MMKYFALLFFIIILILLKSLSYVKSKSKKYKQLQTNEYNKVFCPQCKSNDYYIMVIGSDFVELKCNECNKIWQENI